MAALGSAMDADVSEPGLPSCGAGGVVPGLGIWVRRRVSRGTVRRSCPPGCSMDPRFSSRYPPIRSPGVLPSRTSMARKTGSEPCESLPSRAEGRECVASLHVLFPIVILRYVHY